jgi:hypothetical protein
MPQLMVELYGGYKGEETPRSFTLDGVRLQVKEILKCWYSDTHRCLRVRARDARRYLLRY